MVFLVFSLDEGEIVEVIFLFCVEWNIDVDWRGRYY